MRRAGHGHAVRRAHELQGQRLGEGLQHSGDPAVARRHHERRVSCERWRVLLEELCGEAPAKQGPRPALRREVVRRGAAEVKLASWAERGRELCGLYEELAS